MGCHATMINEQLYVLHINLFYAWLWKVVKKAASSKGDPEKVSKERSQLLGDMNKQWPQITSGFTCSNIWPGSADQVVIVKISHLGI